MKEANVNRAIVFASLVGILVSTYALYVELVADLKPGYKAMCDISEHASCSRVLTSKYSKGLGLVSQESLFKVPNCVYGIIFYCIIIFLSFFLLNATFNCGKNESASIPLILHLMKGPADAQAIQESMKMVQLILQARGTQTLKCYHLRKDTFNQIFAVRLQLFLSTVSLAICVYLAYLLIFVLRDFCVVCVSTYFINAAIAIFLNKKHTLLSAKKRN